MDFPASWMNGFGGRATPKGRITEQSEVQGQSQTGSSGPRVAIIGAGLAGLCAAGMLQRMGWHVDMFERSRELRLGGGILTLWPHGLAALQSMGLDEPIRRAGVAVDRYCVHAWGGALVLVIADHEWRNLLGGMPLHIQRGQLVRALAEHVKPGCIHFGHSCTGVSDVGHGLVPQFQSHSKAGASYDIVIAADGVHSQLAQSIESVSPAAEVGDTLWFGRNEAGPHPWLPPPGEMQLIRGSGVRVFLGTFPKSPGLTTRRSDEHVEWTVWVNEPAGGRSEGGIAPAKDLEIQGLLRRLGGCGLPVDELVRSCPEVRRLRVIDRRQTRKRWAKGRLLAIGDAVHASAPDLGQGACQAFEDVATLHRELQNHTSAINACEQIERIRYARSDVATQWSRTAANFAAASGPWLDAINEQMLRHRFRPDLKDALAAAVQSSPK